MLPSGRDTCKCPSFAEEDASREDDFLDLIEADDDDGARKAVLTDVDRQRHARTRRLAWSINQRPSFTLTTKPNIITNVGLIISPFSDDPRAQRVVTKIKRCPSVMSSLV